MRILIISAAYTGGHGGVATHVINLSYGLVKDFEVEEVHVITLRKPGYEFKKDKKGKLIEWKFKRQDVPEFSGRRVILGNLFAQIAQDWHAIKADVIHVHDWDSVILGWMLRTAFKIPLIMTVHRAPIEWQQSRCRENEKDCLMEILKSHKGIDHVVVPSKASATVLKEQGFRRIKIIPHGLSKHLISFQSDPGVLKRLGIPEDAKIVFCPVRADEHKDPWTFIRAAGGLKKSLYNNKIVFILTSDSITSGSGLDEQDVRATSKIHGLIEGTDIFFTTPFKYGSELATVYRSADIIVIPSIRESFGQTVLDAFMFEKPVVAKNSMALREIVQHENNGLLFSTIKELELNMRCLLLDKELASRLSKRGNRDFKKLYNVPNMVMHYIELYDMAIKRHSIKY